MDICAIFDNIINKDFITYDSIFNEIVDDWYFGDSENIIILSDDTKTLTRLLHEILKKNKRIKHVDVRSYSDECEIGAISYSNILEKTIYLKFNIIDINVFSDFIGKRTRCTDVIIDIEGKSLRNIKLPFGEDVIKEVIYPMMVIPKVSRDNFITLLY